MCLPDFYAFVCDVLGVISLTILDKIYISIYNKTCKNMHGSKCEDSRLALRA